MSSINVDTIKSREGGPPTLSRGVVVSAAATFSSDVSIGGTLTYEDVTNVDVVGLITARSGIELGAAGIGGTIRANGDTTLVGVVTATGFNASGIVTAASFQGDGSALTGMASTDNVSTSTLNVVGISTLLGNVGIGTTFAQLQLHIQDGKLASAPTPNSNCDVVIEGAVNTGIQFLSATQTQLRFGDAAENAAGALIYQHTDDNFKLNYKTATGKVSLNDGGGEKASFGTGGLNVSGMATVTGDVNVGSAVTVYASAGIVSATAYYGDGSNLSGAGGMWALMASADIASYGSNEYDLYTDFASHTDKKWWKLVFRIEAPSGDNDFSGCGLRVKTSGTWRSSDYDFQQFYVESTNENGSRKNNQSRFSFTDRDEKWHSGEILFYNPHGTDFYKVLSYSGYAANYQWEATTDSPNITRAVGGYVGDQGAFEGIRLWKNSGSFGPIHFGLFAGNGW